MLLDEIFSQKYLVVTLQSEDKFSTLSLKQAKYFCRRTSLSLRVYNFLIPAFLSPSALVLDSASGSTIAVYMRKLRLVLEIKTKI